MIVTLMLNPNDCPLRHFTDVSDVQTLASQAVGESAPSRTTKEYERCPNPDPCTVTLTDPVCGALPLDIELSVTESTEADWETLPTRIPEVMTTRLELESELTVRHLTDVTDSHSVPSHPVAPDRTIDVYATSPRFAPRTVTDADPVPARFADRYGSTCVMVTCPINLSPLHEQQAESISSASRLTVIDVSLLPRTRVKEFAIRCIGPQPRS